MIAPRLYLVTDRRATAGRSLVDVVAAALRGAAPFRRADGRLPVAVQLREKDLPAAELVVLGRALAAVTREAGAALFVNDRVDVALSCGAQGVHLPAAGLLPADARAIAPELAIAVSTHSPEEAGAAAAAGAQVVVFGPVFDTPSKRGVIAPRGLDGLAQAAGAVAGRGALIAIGGITPERASACFQSGAEGVACIRAVLSAPDPAAIVDRVLAVRR